MVPTSTYDVCSGLDRFSVIGINYHNANTTTRSNFAICSDKLEQITQLAISKNITDLMVLSTCNRTEIYGVGSADTLVSILCEASGNSRVEFDAHGYTVGGMDAVNHLFKVASGLDSQILGDYEILMQLKKSAKYARENNLLGSLTDRLINFALQASKRIKSETRLSTGTVSVAYAAIEVLKEKIEDIRQKSILLVGAGKFGCNVAKNICEYFPGAKVRITNRTPQKAEDFANTYGLEYVPYEQLREAADESDVLIVSTNAEAYTILPSFFNAKKDRLMLDLSVPKSIDPDVSLIEGVSLLDVDQISVMLSKTFEMRRAEVPKAISIIESTTGEFVEWHKLFMHRGFLGEVKSKLQELSADNCCGHLPEQKNANIQKAVKTLAVDLRSRTAKGCQYINTINEYLRLP